MSDKESGLQPEEEVDLFELGFGEGSGDTPKVEDPPEDPPEVEDPPEEKPEGDDPEDPPEEKPEGDDPKDKPEGDDLKDTPEDKPKDKPKVAEPKEEPKPKQKSEEEIRAELKREQEDKEKADRAAAEEAKRQEERERAAQLSEEEKKELEALEKDFPEVRKALQMQERVLMARAEKMIEDTTRKLQEAFAPALQSVQRVAQNDHQRTIMEKHPDAYDLIDDVNAWVDSKPKFMQSALKKTLADGTAEDVVELLDTFKAEKGGTVDPEEKARKEREAQEAKEAAEKAEAEKKRKLASQTGVKSRNPQRAESVDEDDFEGGFEAFAREQDSK